MKKVVSMFMAMAMAMTFTMGPVVARAEDECGLELDVPNTVNSTNSTGWVWCKENPKDCVIYLGETALNKTKLVGGEVKDAIAGVAQAIRGHNYTRNFETAKENVKWAYEKTLTGAKWIGSEVSDKWSNTVSPWFSEKADDVVKFEKQVEDFYNYDLNNQPKWVFWTLMTSVAVGALTLGTWFLNLITCCGCGRCRLRML